MNKNLLKFVWSMLTAVFFTISVNGQGVTSSSFNGSVTDTKGEPLVGATVVAKHLPSGSMYATTTRTDGKYNLPNVRIGGPYTVSVTYVGYKTNELNDVYLALGQSFRASFNMQDANSTLSEVVISAEKNKILNSDRTGAETNINNEAIQSMPTLNRNLNDFVRLTPQGKSSSVASTTSSGTAFAGQDSRFNNLTIDGSIFNNSFGLASLPGGQTNSAPISLDAIQEIQVNIAPYDVRQGGFTGAGINAVTRSGTNKLEGSAFYNLRNDGFVGNNAAGTDVIANEFNIKQIGFRLGGPIIKNKLFFFVNGEFERRDDPATSFLAARDGVTGSNVTRVRASSMDSLSQFLISNYGYDPGAYEGYNLETYSDKALAKLDYNLTGNTRVSLRYNYLKSNRDVTSSNSGSFNNRSGNLFSMNFQNSNYVINNDIHSVIAEANTLYGNRMSNTVQVGFTANRDYRSSRGGIFPLVDILEDGRNYTTFGYEPFTPNNRLNTDTWQFQDNLTFYGGNHTITAGVNFEYFKFENTFTPTYYGQFVYSSLNDFYAAAAGDTSVVLRRFANSYSALPGGALPTSTTRVAQPGAYIQDVISLNDDKLKVTAGLRVDVPIYGNTALENTAVTAMTFKDENGADVQYNTSKLPDTKPLWSPRIGFNWDVKGDRSLQVRGGTGIFSGRPAFVWISNQVGNNGILSGSSRIDNTKDYPFNTDVTAYIPANPTTPSSFNIAVTDNDFRFPQLFRTNLAVDKKLPFGIVGTIEGIYNRQINNVKYINANLEPSTTTFAGPDNRAIYPGIGLSGTAQNNALRINDNITDATVLKNTKEGYSYTLTGKLERQFQKGLYIMAAYNFGQAQDLMTAGSIAFSSWRDLTSVNGNNNATISYSDFDQRHRIIGALSYKFDYSKVTNTSVSLFFQSGTQGRYSFIVNGDMNGDQLTANDLIYVPKDGSEIRFADIKDANGNVTQSAAEQNAAFMTFVDNNEYLSSRKGSYAERNGALMPWLTTLDLTIMQDIYVYKTHKLTLRADIFNFGNIISNAWGVGDRVINNVPLKYVTKDADNYPVYNFNKVSGSYPTEALQKSNTLGDVWQAQLGVRYTF